MNRELLDSSKIYLFIATVLAVVFVVLSVVLVKSQKKPQSPQAMIAAAIQQGDIFTPREWKPGMGPQPFIYHPAAVWKPVWQHLPEIGFDADWQVLPDISGQMAPLKSALGIQPTIRNYTGPIQ